MTADIFEKMMGVLFHPTETFAETIRSDTLKDTLIYLLILVVVFTSSQESFCWWRSMPMRAL